MPPTNFYHRLGEQISAYAEEILPDFVKELQDKMKIDLTPGVAPVEAPQTHVQRMAQSKRGHQNPGPGKKVKPF